MAKTQYPLPDRRYGLIWGSPEADLGAPDNDYPLSHPFYYQNAACVWRGLTEHVKCLRKAGTASGDPSYVAMADCYDAIAKEMRVNVQRVDRSDHCCIERGDAPGRYHSV